MYLVSIKREKVEENIGENICGLESGRDFLDKTKNNNNNNKPWKKVIDKFDLIKMETFALQKTLLRK